MPSVAITQNTTGGTAIFNYSHYDMKAGAQTWQIAQDRNGIMYFANNSGLITFNNREWKRYPIPNKTIARSLFIAPDGKIYVGAQDEFGYFFPDEQGELQYHSLTKWLPPAERSFADVWNIVVVNNTLILRTSKKIYSIHLQNKKTTIFKSRNNNSWRFMALSGGKLFAYNDEDNLVYLNIDKPEIQKANFKNALVASVLDYGRDTFLIITSGQGIYKMTRNQATEMPVDARLRREQIFSAYKVNENTFAIGTTSNGIYFINKEGSIMQHFSEENGMQNNNVLSMFADKDGNLWSGLDEGVDVINYHSPFKFIKPLSKKIIPCYTSAVFNSQLYVGTSNGLYVTPFTLPASGDIAYSPGSFEKVTHSENQVWNISLVDDKVLMGHHEGIFLINGKQASLVSRQYEGAWIFRLLQGKNKIITGTYEGLQLMHQNASSIMPAADFQNQLRESLRFVEVDESKHTVWASHPYRGIYEFKMSGNYDKVIKLRLYTKRDGLPGDLNNYVFKINDDIIFGTENGVYEYDPVFTRFAKSKKYYNIFGPESIRFLTQDANKRVWFATYSGIGVVEENKPYYFRELNGQLIGGFENIYPYNDRNIFIGSYKGLIHLNYTLYKNNKRSIRTLLSKVVAIGDKDSLLFNGYFTDSAKILSKQNKQLIYKLSPQFNSLYFEYGSDAYNSPAKISYSYLLKNFDKEWSAWSDKPDKDYTNLPYGNYTFEVKAKDIVGNISEATRFSFTILPKWYQTKLAYILYVLAFISIIWVLHKMVQRRLRLQKAKHDKEQQQLKYLHDLEIEHNEKQITQLQNEKLEADIRYKNKELATTTMHLYKRGRLLGKIKDDLFTGVQKLKTKEEKSDFNKLLKLITEEEKRDSDWEQFSIHFDEVHNNFLSNIKKAYSELSPADLKICAYLKMNLSSKEIAQLLNLSLKGVESARYRLRKKLGISFETNLSGFVQNFDK